MTSHPRNSDFQMRFKNWQFIRLGLLFLALLCTLLICATSISCQLSPLFRCFGDEDCPKGSRCKQNFCLALPKPNALNCQKEKSAVFSPLETVVSIAVLPNKYKGTNFRPMATVDTNGMLYLWDAEKHKIEHVVELKGSGPFSQAPVLLFHPKGSYLFVLEHKIGVYTFSLIKSQETSRFELLEQKGALFPLNPDSIAMGPAGEFILVAAKASKGKGKELTALPISGDVSSEIDYGKLPIPGDAEVRWMKFSADGRYLLWATDDKMLRCTSIKILRDGDNVISTITFSPTIEKKVEEELLDVALGFKDKKLALAFMKKIEIYKFPLEKDAKPEFTYPLSVKSEVDEKETPWVRLAFMDDIERLMVWLPGEPYVMALLKKGDTFVEDKDSLTDFDSFAIADRVKSGTFWVNQADDSLYCLDDYNFLQVITFFPSNKFALTWTETGYSSLALHPKQAHGVLFQRFRDKSAFTFLSLENKSFRESKTFTIDTGYEDGAVTFSPDGKYLLLFLSKGTVEGKTEVWVWPVTEKEKQLVLQSEKPEKFTLPIGLEPYTSLRWQNGEVLWLVAEGLIQTFHTMRFSAKDGTVSVEHLRSLAPGVRFVPKDKKSVKLPTKDIPKDHSFHLGKFAVNQDGTKLVGIFSGTGENELVLEHYWHKVQEGSKASYIPEKIPEIYFDYIGGFAFHPFQDWFAYIVHGTIGVIPFGTGKSILYSFQLEDQKEIPVYRPVFHPKGRTLFTFTRDNSGRARIRLWDLHPDKNKVITLDLGLAPERKALSHVVYQRNAEKNTERLLYLTRASYSMWQCKEVASAQ